MKNPNSFQPGQAIDTEDALNDEMYPRLPDESEEDYKARLDKMHADVEAWQSIGKEESKAEEPKENAVDIMRKRMEERVADGTYTQEEADARIAKAEAHHEDSLKAAAAAEEAAEQQAKDDAAYQAWAQMSDAQLKQRSDELANGFAGEENINSATGKERSNSLFDQYPRLAGESNEEYGKRIRNISEALKQFKAENPEEEPAPEVDAYTAMVNKRVENGNLTQEEADRMIANREARDADKKQAEAEARENEQAKNNAEEAAKKEKMDMAERLRKNDPEAKEFLKNHPELKLEMVAAVRDLEELDALTAFHKKADNRVEDALNKRNDEFMKANDAFLAAKESYDNASKANEEARAEMKSLEERASKGESISDDVFAAAEAKIKQTEEDMKKAEAEQEKAKTDKKTISDTFDKLAAETHTAQARATENYRKRQAAREQYVKGNEDAFNASMNQALMTQNAAKKTIEESRAKLDDLKTRAEKGEAVDDAEIKKLENNIKASELIVKQTDARMNELKQGQVNAANVNVMEENIDKALGIHKEKNPDAALKSKMIADFRKTYNEAKKMYEDSSAELADLEKRAAAGEKISEMTINEVKAKVNASKMMMNGAAESIKSVEKGLGVKAEKSAEDSKFEEFRQSYLKDNAWRNMMAKDGIKSDSELDAALRKMYKEKQAEEAEKKKPDDGLETAEQKGLFAKIRNLFSKNKRSKDGAERAIQKESKPGRFKNLAFVALYSLLVLGPSLANSMQVQAPTQTGFDTMHVMAADNLEGTTFETTDDDGEDKNVETVDLGTVSANLTLNPDLNVEQGEKDPDIVNTVYSDGTDLEINMSYGDYEESAYFAENKEGPHNLTPWLYDFENTEMTDAERAEQIQENLNQLADDPTIQGQIAGFLGDDLQIDGHSMTSFADMRDVQIIAQQDEEFRLMMADEVRDINTEFVDNNTLNLYHVDKGTVYGSLYALNTAEAGEMPRLLYYRDDEVTAHVDFEVMQYLDENDQNILDTNEIGGYKYNFLKSAGVIPENATDEEAQEIMAKYKILGISGKCGQVIWVTNNPDSGDETSGKESKDTSETGSEKETDEGSGSEKDTDEGTGSEKETDEGTGTEKETDEGTGTEKETSETGTEKETAETGTEKEGSETGTEKEGSETGTEKEDAETGTEKEGTETGTEKETSETGTEYEDTGKEGGVPGEPGDGWTTEDAGQDESGPTTEAGDDAGDVNDNAPGGSSDIADDDALNGGDQGGGNNDADGGGSNDADTESTYDGSDTSGWQGDDQSGETGTQDVQDPDPADNDSDANQDASGDTPSDSDADAEEAMNRL